MTPREASELIGCSVSHIRHLIREGLLKAKAVKSVHNQHGYEWDVDKKDCLRFKDKPQTVGFPRGKKRC